MPKVSPIALCLPCLFLSGAQSSECSLDEIATFRSSFIRTQFDPKLMKGLWYEHAFSDPAQVGASCQTLAMDINSSTGAIQTNFSVKYLHKVPFTIVENYKPRQDGIFEALYTKSVIPPVPVPGEIKVSLPTVVLDAHRSDDGARYETLILYSCLGTFFGQVHEVMIATRNQAEDAATIQSLINLALSAGLPLSTKDISLVNRSSCTGRTTSSTAMMI